jgi:colicin import membrane protein
MRPTEFSNEVIITAGNTLQDDGRNVTGFALRQKIGGGNPNRLKQVWDEYIASQTVQAEPMIELPVEVEEEVNAVAKALTERIAKFAIELNNKAVKAAERRVTEVVRSAGEQREHAQRELIDAAQTVDELEEKLDVANNQVSTLEQHITSTQETNQLQEIELAQLREYVKAMDRQNEEMHQRMQRTENERDTAQKAASKAREEVAKLEGKIETLQSQFDHIVKTLSDRLSTNSGKGKS